MFLGGTMEEKIEIQKLDNQGRGIGYFHEKPIFVLNALPSEIVFVSDIKERSKYSTAKQIKILKKSSKRIDAPCSYFSICGGCDLMHLSHQEQLNYKEKKVRNILSKKIDSNIFVRSIIPCNVFSYRNKAIFKVKEKIGYYGKETHEIIPIEKCMLVTSKINEILKELKTVDLDGISEILIRSSDIMKESMVVLKMEEEKDISHIEERLKKKVTTLVTLNKNYKVIFGNGFIHEKLGNFIFKISPESFFQVNTEGAFKLYSTILTYIDEKDRILDLYCGTGSIGIFVSQKASSILGVELNQYAVLDAIENKKLNKLENAEFLCLNTSLFTKDLSNFDVVIIDPPRSGLDKKTLSYLLKEEVKKIIYVSCDLMTFTRDLELLKTKYDIIEVTPFDLFPNTYHVECVCVLNRR